MSTEKEVRSRMAEDSDVDGTETKGATVEFDMDAQDEKGEEEANNDNADAAQALCHEKSWTKSSHSVDSGGSGCHRDYPRSGIDTRSCG